MTRLSQAVCAILATALPAGAFAHPGHGTTRADGPLHLVVDHPVLALVVLGSIGLAASGLAHLLDRR